MDGEYTGLSFRRMSAADRQDVYALLEPAATLPAALRTRAEASLAAALRLFEDRPDFGFVWVAYRDERALACCTVAFGISATHGGLVARIDDFGVAAEASVDIIERTIAALGEALRSEEAVRVEATVDLNAAAYAQTLEGMGFRNIQRLTWSIAAGDLEPGEA